MRPHLEGCSAGWMPGSSVVARDVAPLSVPGPLAIGPTCARVLAQLLVAPGVPGSLGILAAMRDPWKTPRAAAKSVLAPIGAMGGAPAAGSGVTVRSS